MRIPTLLHVLSELGYGQEALEVVQTVANTKGQKGVERFLLGTSKRIQRAVRERIQDPIELLEALKSVVEQEKLMLSALEYDVTFTQTVN